METHKNWDPLDISEYMNPSSLQRKSSVTFAKPAQIGAFSIDGQRKFCHDSSELAYLEDKHNLPRSMDLNDGYKDRFIKRDDNVKERLNHLLRWFVSNLHRFEKSADGGKDQSIGPFPDFILWRGHMTKIMCTPYENQDGWEMAAQKVGSTIYMSEVETAEAEKRRLSQSEREKVMAFWGVRFEKYMTRPDPPSSKAPRLSPTPQKNVLVNTNKAYCTVLKGEINSHKIIHSAEVDCCCHPDELLLSPDNYIELKTNREFTARKQEENFHRYKTKKWWAQSFLAGVPQITCGFRNDKGTIVRIQDFKTLDLPKMARSVPGGGWDANICLLFLENFFSFVKNVFKETNEESVAIFTWIPGSRKVTCISYHKPSKHEFLPEWYSVSLKHMQYL